MIAARLLTIALAAATLAAPAAASGAIPWETFALARSVTKDRKAVVSFPAALAAANGRSVTVQGFMVPLEARPEQVRFLLTSKPQDCEFCMEGGPASFIEVRSSVPLKFTSQAMTLVGRLAVLPDDPSGVFYRLTEARPAR